MIDFMKHDQSLPEEEGRYSFGTTPAIDKLLDVVNMNKSKNGNVFLINLSTLVRNRWKKDLKLQKVVDLVKQDVSGLSSEISETCKLVDNRHQHFIILYTMAYSRMVPDDYLHNRNTEQRAKIQDATVMLIKQLPSVVKIDGNCTCEILHDNGKKPSFKVLSSKIKSVGGNQTAFIISHIPLDYHIFDVNICGYVIKSFTGDVVDGLKSTLGEMVFKEAIVPFYPATHILLGDKELIKGCLDRKERKRFLELCEQNGWRMRTETYIRDAIFKYGFTLPYTLE